MMTDLSNIYLGLPGAEHWNWLPSQLLDPVQKVRVAPATVVEGLSPGRPRLDIANLEEELCHGKANPLHSSRREQ